MVRLDDASLDIIFREARTFTRWQARPVDDTTLEAVWRLARMGPTSANCSPIRVVFVKSAAAKRRLEPHLSRSNVASVMASPVTAILAHDLAFYERLPQLFGAEAVSWFKGKANLAETALRNGSLQGAYLMIAARALGLDCGPMSGFDNAGVDSAFFADRPDWRSNFILNLGYGEREGLEPRRPRLEFAEACRIV
jgi:3-hydroxypropanoate dehydrogenase